MKNNKYENATLEDLKPSYRAWHVTAEHKGFRYLITHATNLYAAEHIALDYVATYPAARFYTGDIYGSQRIHGNAKTLRIDYAEAV